MTKTEARKVVNKSPLGYETTRTINGDKESLSIYSMAYHGQKE